MVHANATRSLGQLDWGSICRDRASCDRRGDFFLAVFRAVICSWLAGVQGNKTPVALQNGAASMLQNSYRACFLDNLIGWAKGFCWTKVKETGISRK